MRNNALFIKRFIAFVLDMFLIAFCTSVIVTPFVNTENTEKLQKQSSELVEKATSGEIDANTYLTEASVIVYRSQRNNGLYTIIKLLFGVLYFIVYQFYKGQTVGKRVMKIKVESNEGDLTINQMVVRSLVVDAMLFNFIIFAFCLFTNSSSFFIGYCSVIIVEIIVLGLCGLMCMFRKDHRGLHDIICNTKVVNVK